VASHDPAVQLQNLPLQHPQLDAESSDTGARDLGQPFVARIGNDPEQFIDTMASDRGDDLQPTADDTLPSPSRAIAYPGGQREVAKMGEFCSNCVGY
jgi:hypothetical protein